MEKKKKNGYSKIGYLAYQSKKITELIDGGKLFLAKRLIINLMQDYPDDDTLKSQLARVLTFQKEYKEALSVLDEVPKEFSLVRMTALCVKLNDEDRLFELYQKYYSLDSPTSTKLKDTNTTYARMQNYLRIKFDPSYCLSINDHSYFNQQVYSYCQEAALNYIKKNHYLQSFLEKSYFSSDIDIDSLFYSVQEYICSHPEKAALRQNIADSYLFYYPYCGKSGNGNSHCDYFEVITFINCPQIISMYPSHQQNYMEICYLDQKDKSDKVVKVKSGLERFKDRYSKVDN